MSARFNGYRMSDPSQNPFLLNLSARIPHIFTREWTWKNHRLLGCLATTQSPKQVAHLYIISYKVIRKKIVISDAHALVFPPDFHLPSSNISHSILVGSVSTPIETYARVKLDHFIHVEIFFKNDGHHHLAVWATFKTLVTFHYIYWLINIGILISWASEIIPL